MIEEYCSKIVVEKVLEKFTQYKSLLQMQDNFFAQSRKLVHKDLQSTFFSNVSTVFDKLLYDLYVSCNSAYFTSLYSAIIKNDYKYEFLNIQKESDLDDIRLLNALIQIVENVHCTRNTPIQCANCGAEYSHEFMHKSFANIYGWYADHHLYADEGLPWCENCGCFICEGMNKSYSDECNQCPNCHR